MTGVLKSARGVAGNYLSMCRERGSIEARSLT